MFKNEEELTDIRKSTNFNFCEKQESGSALLGPQEELQVVKYYMKKLVEVCSLFAPPKWAPLPRTALVSCCMW